MVEVILGRVSGPTLLVNIIFVLHYFAVVSHVQRNLIARAKNMSVKRLVLSQRLAVEVWVSLFGNAVSLI